MVTKSGGGDSPEPTLLRLPPEIRNQIFKLAVVENQPLGGTSPNSFFVPDRKPFVPSPIAQVCRQTRREILPVYYGANTFVVTGDRIPLIPRSELNMRIPRAANFMKRILLTRSNGWRQGQSSDAPFLPELSKKRQVKIDHTGESKDRCTCELEVAAAEMAKRSKSKRSNPLFIATGALTSATAAQSNRQMRTADCKFGARIKAT